MVRHIGALHSQFQELQNCIIVDIVESITNGKFNGKQLNALFEDIQSIFEEPREKVNGSIDIIGDLEDFSDTEEEEAKINCRLHHTEYDSIHTESTSSSVLSSNSSSKSNPLAFRRDIDEFQFLRYLVLQDPLQLQPLLLSFGQSHPDIMRIINQNKDIFVSMLHEQTGAKLSGRH